ncbi:MAG: RIP metalloprotease RseP [Firmicutes bacterium]|nr:RIP metalloprotease RseP [Bacillota bacterium]
MKRFLYVAPALILFALSPRAVGILGSVLMIAGLIFVHELGHFLAAKRMGMPVEVFSLGFGPRLLGFRWKETDVRLSALPLGGYVKLSGYNPEEPDAEDPHGFLKQPFGKRMIFYSGGVLANLATALVLLSILGVDQARAIPHVPPQALLVTDVTPNMPAFKAGLKAGDEIVALDALTFPDATVDTARAYIEHHPGQALNIRIQRNGATQELQITPVDQNGAGKIGIMFGPSKIIFERQPMTLKSVGQGLAAGAVRTAGLTWMITKNFVKLFTFQANFKEVGGPITIARAGSAAAKAGWETFLGLCAMISINLAVLNALPIPFLDGGHMAILCLEKARGKDFSIRAKERILMIGFVFLMALMVLALGWDLWRLKH